MSLFTGSGVAIVTPFNQDLSVNYNKLEELIDFQIEGGTNSIIICGTTGESSTLSDEEQIECIKVTVDKTAGRVPVIAGAGSNDTHHGIELAKKAQRVGADGLLLVTPYYNKTTQKGLIQHYSDYAVATDLPIMLYNVPSRTGMNILPDTAAELSKIDTIVAMKEASGDIGQVMDMIARCEGRLDLYTGNDDQILPILALGGKGVVSVIANILPRETNDIVTKYFSGDTDGALALAVKLHALMNSMFCETNPIPVKEALNQMGMNAGPTRRPLYPMEEANIAIMRAAMADLGMTLV